MVRYVLMYYMRRGVEVKLQALKEYMLEQSDGRVTPRTRRKKDLVLLELACDANRLHDADAAQRLVCCKSAKDRTSMSVTWEQARDLQLHMHVREGEQQCPLDLMRDRGVRRSNVLKNTLKPYYAFNPLQRTLLPPLLCPPAYTCGKTKS